MKRRLQDCWHFMDQALSCKELLVINIKPIFPSFPDLNSCKIQSLEDFQSIQINFNSACTWDKTQPISQSHCQIPNPYPNLLQVPEKEGGGELLVSSIQTKSNGDGDTVLQIGATRERLLEGAEKICIRKKCKDGSLREFSRGHRDHFDSGSES